MVQMLPDQMFGFVVCTFSFEYHTILPCYNLSSAYIFLCTFSFEDHTILHCSLHNLSSAYIFLVLIE